MITIPQLPPKSGYVEVEIDGERLYRNVVTGVLLRDEGEPNPSESERLDALEQAMLAMMEV